MWYLHYFSSPFFFISQSKPAPQPSSLKITIAGDRAQSAPRRPAGKLIVRRPAGGVRFGGRTGGGGNSTNRGSRIVRAVRN